MKITSIYPVILITGEFALEIIVSNIKRKMQRKQKKKKAIRQRFMRAVGPICGHERCTHTY